MATDVSARLADITPHLAYELLAKNTHNRTGAGRKVEQYAADMRRGDWAINGEAIKISVDGQILDGQHRLRAVIEADVTIQTLVIAGLPSVAQETMDQGRPRSLSDVLKLRGEKYFTALATAARALWLYEQTGALVAPKGGGGLNATTAQALKVIERNPELRESVEYAFTRMKPWMPGTFMGALHYLLASVDQAAADDFVERLHSGAELAATSPIFVLRERLVTARLEQEGLTTKIKLALVIKGWNAYLAGDDLARLTYNPGGPGAEAFPLIDGLAVPATQVPA